MPLQMLRSFKCILSDGLCLRAQRAYVRITEDISLQPNSKQKTKTNKNKQKQIKPKKINTKKVKQLSK